MAGTLDTTFGTNGYTLTNFAGKNQSVTFAQVIDSNNCTIVTGVTNLNGNAGAQLYLAKYTSTGFLDTTFGAGKGYVLGDYYTGKESLGVSIVLDSSGNILVTGYTNDNNNVLRLLLAKYSSNGELDSSFGGGKGWTADIIDNSQFSFGDSIVLDITGRIVITGSVTDNMNFYNPFVARYNVDGTLDKTFGDSGNGYTVVKMLHVDSFGSSIVIDSINGNFTINPTYELTSSIYLIRFTKSGLLDTSFGNGTGYIDIGDIIKKKENNRSMILDKNNNILISGSILNNVSVARFKSDGTLDASFGENSGYTSTSIPNRGSEGYSLVLDSNDRIIVTGASGNNQKIFSTLLLRYTSNGILDKTFGGNGLGYSITDFGVVFQGIEVSFGLAVSLDNNGRIIVSGYASVSKGYASLIARFYNENNEPICLPAGTPILTDQGLVAIELIDPKKHTIAHKAIVAITTTISPEENLVCFEANSMGINCPSQRTLMTPGHEVLYKGKLVQAKHFVGRVNGVHTVPYNGKDVLYNVLQEQHGLMRVNNMLVETLHPENKVAKQILNKEL